MLDTDVLVAAFRSEHEASRQLIIAALDERFVLPASTRFVAGVRSGTDSAARLPSQRLDNAIRVGIRSKNNRSASGAREC